ncbi:SpoIIE family protein phosphatase [Amycolatopsis acidiphila]|uniref:SpoIIE family protein phosphatase n=1 Tax=Amycolatopsis acidiphila TaxID=715473 RepID=A0A558AAE1_9PSEU|nr:SpoIIE family protein phosphatase [Amycolatopsis acidiphila]TVT21223.1 SpoIIE family protein phosphatase [Amycolatopsis acidiphila]UIJ61240.1 SpoIIE family protein phosphatase [Amycolatopsis acidiphila]GHG78632.1 cyclic diguanylate phosphodiesterase [Amycolatopsis acidiphila]
MATTASAEERLRRFGSVSDSALAHIEGDEVLTELLGRVREGLQSDTVAVLLVEPGGRELVATATQGIETEVRQGVRVPLGKGFAGRVAAEKSPVMLDRVDSTTVVNQLLWEKGIQTLVGVPLLVSGEVLGVLHAGSLTPRRFTEDDVEFLQAAADRIALVVHAHQSQAARAAATALQRSLLPPQLPQVPSLDFAARYVPGGGSNVAGDWYDVFTLPNGWLGLVIGDVVGHDLPAAVVMGRLRSALRAYSLETTDPADVLTRLDRKAQHFEPGMMATVLYGTLEPDFGRLYLSSAGHLAPVLARPGEPAHFADLPIDPPIGAIREVRRRKTTIELQPGTITCFYTDGLVERRYAPLDDGLELLRSTVRAASADAVCAQVMTTLIGEYVSEDDVAILTFRRQDLKEVNSLDMIVPAVPESLKDIRAAMRRWLSSAGISGDLAGDLLLAVGEASTNSVEHAYGPAGGTVHLKIDLIGAEVVIRVRDTGHWRPARGENRGRGLTLMNKCGDVQVDRSDEGTTVVIRRRLEAEAQA